MIQCLDNFCACSGQKVSFLKSQLYVSANVSQSFAESLSETLRIPLTNELGKYLGVPSIQGRINRGTFMEVEERISARLEGWKTKFLSLAGRHVLAQSALCSIPYYSMQTNLLPKGLCDNIDRKVRKFIWGSSETKRGCHLVRWEKITKPKSAGGLGIRSMRAMNLAFLAKLGWRLLKEKEPLWTKVLRAKYTKNQADLDLILPSPRCSSTWRGIIAATSILKNGTRCAIGYGSSTSFWKANWMADFDLNSVATTEIPQEDLSCSVRDYWRPDSGWDLHKLIPLLPQHTINTLKGMALSNDDTIEDSIMWNQGPSGAFSVSSAYNLYINPEHQQDGNVWELVWKIRVPNKIKFFMWLVLHERILCNAERKRRHLTFMDDCHRCHGTSEDIEHVLRTCPVALEVWKAIKPPQLIESDLNIHWKDWVVHNLKDKGPKYGFPEWNATFSITCWQIWKWRNNQIFNNENIHKLCKVDTIRNYSREVYNILNRGRFVPYQSDNQNRFPLCWKRPEEGWIAVSVDRSSKGKGHMAGCGGVLRNNTGDWIVGFHKNLGDCPAETAEAWAILTGLKVAWQMAYTNVIIQCDAANVVKRINDPFFDAKGGGTLNNVILECKDWIRKNWNVKCCHILREQNRVADWLARNGNSSYETTLLSFCPSPKVALWVHNDSLEVPYMRGD